MTPSGDHLVACRLRDAAALTLAVTSGATDAISFLALGGAFTSVMTGNLVLLGVSLGHTDSGLARQIGAAVVGYVAGCALGARITGTPVDGEPVWPPAVTRGLAVEAGLFVMYAAGWWAVGGRPGGAAEVGLLGLSALALGIQSASVRRFGVTGAVDHLPHGHIDDAGDPTGEWGAVPKRRAQSVVVAGTACRRRRGRGTAGAARLRACPACAIDASWRGRCGRVSDSCSPRTWPAARRRWRVNVLEV